MYIAARNQGNSAFPGSSRRRGVSRFALPEAELQECPGFFFPAGLRRRLERTLPKRLAQIGVFIQYAHRIEDRIHRATIDHEPADPMTNCIGAAAVASGD